MIQIPEYKKKEYLTSLNEDNLFMLVQSYWTDIIDLNIENPTSVVDWYVPSTNTYFEAKCRNIEERFLYIEKKKYDDIIDYSNICYINSCADGIFFWELTRMEEPIWITKYMEKSQQFNGKGELVPKEVAQLDIKKAFQIDHLLIQYI